MNAIISQEKCHTRSDFIWIKKRF